MARKDALFIPVVPSASTGFHALAEEARQSPDPVSAALGMYLFSNAAWLAQEMQQGGFDRIVFIARDGWWVKQAYDLVAPAMGVKVPSDYVRISRQASFPLHFRTPEELKNLPEWVNITAHTERTLMQLLSPNLLPGAADAAGENRLTETDLPAFIGACRRLWDASRAEAYRAHAHAYIAPKFAGKCATFDVGYNLRSESVIRSLTGADVTAFVTHIDSPHPEKRGVPFHTLYPDKPFVSWVAREQFLLEDAPLCVGYGENGPALSAQSAGIHPNMRRCQQAALDFVMRIVNRYGSRLAEMPLRPTDGCMPFEHFLHCGPYRLMKPFRQNAVENAFHSGRAGEDSTFLQWRLMQTDLLLTKGVPHWRVRLKRALIRLREDPQSFLRKLNPFASE